MRHFPNITKTHATLLKVTHEVVLYPKVSHYKVNCGLLQKSSPHCIQNVFWPEFRNALLCFMFRPLISLHFPAQG